MAPQKTPALELSTLTPDRLIVAIDDAKFSIHVVNDFGLLDQVRIDKLRVPMAEYYDATKSKKGVTDDQIEAMADSLAGLVEMIVMDLPKAVAQKLTDVQRLEIVQLFMIGPPPTPRKRSTNNRATPRTTGGSSPAAKGSTGATRKGG